MIKLFLTLCFSLLLILSGCSSKQEEIHHSNSKGMYQSATFTSPSKVSPLELRDYVRELVAEMALNIRFVDVSNAIAVTNFVSSDSDYQSTNDLGFAIADSFMVELHQFGFKTLDVKVTDYIRVTPQGDFAMSTDYLELQADTTVEYVLVGKITDFKTGYKVSARIVDIKNKNIMASAESFIPKKFVSKLISKTYCNGTDSSLEVSS